MIGNELLRKVRTHRGKLLAPLHTIHDVVHIAIEKKDFMDYLSQVGDRESGFVMIQLDNGAMCIDSDDGMIEREFS